jgi:hypothetical protein
MNGRCRSIYRRSIYRRFIYRRFIYRLFTFRRFIYRPSALLRRLRPGPPDGAAQG